MQFKFSRIVGLSLTMLFFAAAANAAPLEREPIDPVGRLVSVRLPEKVLFCGKEVPIAYEDVRERLELELLVILGSPVQTALWLKRMPRYFPQIEAELKNAGLPDDLKYVAVAESNLKADALSKAGASGPWQFIKSTGSEKGLRQTRCVDERRDWDKSTLAAMDFLKELNNTFHDWPLSLAAYNAGPGRVMDAMREQGETGYYGLKLPLETERYVFRIIAAKLVGENPESFGVDMSQASLYSELETSDLEFYAKKPVSVNYLSTAAGISYRYMLILNPWMTGAPLSEGRYMITVPAQNAPRLASALKNSSVREAQEKKAESPAPAAPTTVALASAEQLEAAQKDETASSYQPQPAEGASCKTYSVAAGDSLSSIAKKHSVKLGELMSANKLTKESAIRPGQKLVIP